MRIPQNKQIIGNKKLTQNRINNEMNPRCEGLAGTDRRWGWVGGWNGEEKEGLRVQAVAKL